MKLDVKLKHIFNNRKRLYEAAMQQQHVQQQPNGITKDDKDAVLKSYKEYWNFEKMYHPEYKKLWSGNMEDSEQSAKVINMIIGNAATCLGLNWDWIKDKEYLFGFYKIKGGNPKNMLIKVPYTFTFPSLHNKLLGWFKNDKDPIKNQKDAGKNPTIKVESRTINYIKQLNERLIAKTADTINTNVDNNGERIATAISTPVFDLLENIFNKFADDIAAQQKYNNYVTVSHYKNDSTYGCYYTVYMYIMSEKDFSKIVGISITFDINKDKNIIKDYKIELEDNAYNKNATLVPKGISKDDVNAVFKNPDAFKNVIKIFNDNIDDIYNITHIYDNNIPITTKAFKKVLKLYKNSYDIVNLTLYDDTPEVLRRERNALFAEWKKNKIEKESADEQKENEGKFITEYDKLFHYFELLYPFASPNVDKYAHLDWNRDYKSKMYFEKSNSNYNGDTEYYAYTYSIRDIKTYKYSFDMIINISVATKDRLYVKKNQVTDFTLKLNMYDANKGDNQRLTTVIFNIPNTGKESYPWYTMNDNIYTYRKALKDASDVGYVKTFIDIFLEAHDKFEKLMPDDETKTIKISLFKKLIYSLYPKKYIKKIS